MFDHSDVHEIDKRLEESMPFLYNLIQEIFIHNQEARLREANVRKARAEQKEKPCETHLPASLPLEDLSQSSTSSFSSTINSSSRSGNTQFTSELEVNSFKSDDESDLDVDPIRLDDTNNDDLGGGTIGEENEYVHSWEGYVF